jgi:hypothetical protein
VADGATDTERHFATFDYCTNVEHHHALMAWQV